MRSKKSLLTTSSFNCASQLSSKDWISNANKSFCSGVSFSTHFALSNFGAGTAAAAVDVLAAVKTEAVVAVAVAEAVDLAEVSSLAVVGEDGMGEEIAEAAAAAGLFVVAGVEKNDVMEALAFGFFALEAAMSAALRLRGADMVVFVQRCNQLWEGGASRKCMGGLWKDCDSSQSDVTGRLGRVGKRASEASRPLSSRRVRVRKSRAPARCTVLNQSIQFNR